MFAFSAFLHGEGPGTACLNELSEHEREGKHPLITSFKYDFVLTVLARFRQPLAFATPQLIVAEDYWRARNNGDLLAAVHLVEKSGYRLAECRISDISAVIARFIATRPSGEVFTSSEGLFLFGGAVVFQEPASPGYGIALATGGGIGRHPEEAVAEFITSYRLCNRLLEHEAIGYALRVREISFDELISEYAYRFRPYTLH